MSEKLPQFDASDSNEIFSILESERFDLAVRELFEQAWMLELELNRDESKLTDEDEEMLIGQLNDNANADDLYQTEMTLAGMIRFGMLDDDDDPLEYEWIAQRITEGAVLGHDGLGHFLYVDDFTVNTDGFSRNERDDFYDPATGRYVSKRAEVILDLDPEDSGEHLLPYALPGELQSCHPIKPSLLTSKYELQTHYPDIYDQIRELPNRPGDDDVIFEYLRHFTLTVDWGRYPDLSEQDRSRVLTYVERCINDRMPFDTAFYELMVEDTYFTPEPEQEVFDEIPLGKSSKIFAGYIAETILMLLPEESKSDVLSYAPMLDFSAQAAERFAKPVSMAFPVSSIRYHRNTRDAASMPSEFDDNDA